MEEMEYLQNQVIKLRQENEILKALLKRNHISFKEYLSDESYHEPEQFDPNQGKRIIHPTIITKKMANYFYSRFWGRQDVFALRYESKNMDASGKDFANVDDEWRKEVDGMRKICEKNGIVPLVERSRSGKGAHLWIFFQNPIPAKLARRFGFALLEKGAEEVN